VAVSCALLTACGGKKPARADTPPPPPIVESSTEPSSQRLPVPDRPVEEGKPEKPRRKSSRESESVTVATEAGWTETGMASWYGAPYHNRRASNGEIYNMRAMTAAHRTLPLGSIVRVTNLKSGDAVIVRITDRGPFIRGRVVDLSQAAAEKIGLIKAGVMQVKVELVKASLPLEQGGRWAVQIGAFQEEDPARAMAGRISRRYQTAKVLCFSSPVGDWWVRVRVQHDEKARAEQLVHETSTAEGAIFLVRLD
jgi:rare lipoprotein A